MIETPRKKFILGSIEDASILRKFTILFLLMSLIPLTLLWYIYIQIRDSGTVQIDEFSLNLALIFVASGVIVGYFSMRAVLVRLVKLSVANRRALENLLSPERIRELGKEENEIAVLAQSFTEITRRLEDNVKSLELAKRTLHSVLAKVGHGISSMNNIDTFLELILETITTGLKGRIGVLMILSDTKKDLVVRTVYGAPFNQYEEIRVGNKEGTFIHDVIKSKKPKIALQGNFDIAVTIENRFLFKEPLICAPLVVRDHVKGVITISGGGQEGEFREEELSLLYNLASQMAVALENARLNQDIEKTYFETISALALAVDAKDKYSRGHLDRVANYCIQIAQKLGLDDGDIKILRDAARLHDLGKIGIPDEVLGKKGPLNTEEWLLMREHTKIGESIIKPIRSLNHLCDIIRHHHEKLDGSGYPDGLKGDQITPLVRITTIADIYDALTSKRSYRNVLSKQEAINELRRMGDKIDQDIVEVFAETLDVL